MQRSEDSSVDPATPRGYGGVRITAPRGRSAAPAIGRGEVLDESGKLIVSTGTQARILTGAALFGVVAIVLLHELGHWLAGLAVTGRAPDFLGIAVRQKVDEFSTAEGILVWGMGPLVHLVLLWGIVLIAAMRGRSAPRTLAIAGGAAVFSVAVNLFIWVTATFSSESSWNNDIPRVATFFDSSQRVWMHLLSALMTTAILGAAYTWWWTVKATGRSSMYFSAAATGAVEGAVIVVAGTVLIALWD